ITLRCALIALSTVGLLGCVHQLDAQLDALCKVVELRIVRCANFHVTGSGVRLLATTTRLRCVPCQRVDPHHGLGHWAEITSTRTDLYCLVGKVTALCDSYPPGSTVTMLIPNYAEPRACKELQPVPEQLLSDSEW